MKGRCRLCNDEAGAWSHICDLCRMGRRKLEDGVNVCFIAKCQQCGTFVPRKRYYCAGCDVDRARNRAKVRTPAAAAVAKAVRLGQLPPANTLNCVDCGSAAFDYDHRDYSKPLDVQPVCRSCNTKRGPAIQLQRMGEAA